MYPARSRRPPIETTASVKSGRGTANQSHVNSPAGWSGALCPRTAPRVQVNLDELEEDLDDYGEYIRAEAEGAGGPPTPEEFRGDAAGVGGLIGVPREGREGREAPEAEPPEREDGAADRGMGAATGGTDPLEGGVAGGSGRGRQLDHAEKENPSQGPVGWDQRRGSPLRGRRPAVPPQIARGMFAWSQSRGGP